VTSAATMRLHFADDGSNLIEQFGESVTVPDISELFRTVFCCPVRCPPPLFLTVLSRPVSITRSTFEWQNGRKTNPTITPKGTDDSGHAAPAVALGSHADNDSGCRQSHIIALAGTHTPRSVSENRVYFGSALHRGVRLRVNFYFGMEPGPDSDW
jgi:hypothetical protein